ncbi:MAG: serine/threonine protein kinase [Myxococcales bacterium]|jgi:serine/threonine protein kinase|nr:serine/threonine protein kinase [Myxococcales bacterium]
MPPRIVGQYQLHSLLGTGGIGSVYRAIDRQTGDEVALKLLSSGVALDAKAARRMAREFEALFTLDHENIVRVFKTGVWHGYPYLTMELIEGINLRQYLAVGAQSASMPRQRAFAGGQLDPFDLCSFESFLSAPNAERHLTNPYGCLEESSSSDLDSSYGEGPEALRRLADAIDEPLTMDEDEEAEGIDDPSKDDDPRWADSPGPRSAKPRKPSAPPTGAHLTARLSELNAPERLAKLRDALLQICQALAYVHARGLVHRDIKPSNIMVDREQRVKLMDFGLAKHLASDTEVTAVGHIVGTYRYMAPEQLRSERLDGRTDLYALGVVLYEQLAGRPPFDGPSTIEVCKKILEEEPVPLAHYNPGVDDSLARVTHWLLDKNVEARIQTAEELYEVLLSSE